MTDVTDERRRRIAKALFLVGLGLILAGAAVLVQHHASVSAVRPVVSGSGGAHAELKARAMREVLFWLLVFVGIFAVSTFAFLRWSRRFRRWVFYTPHPPTPADDVWAMHRLPDEGPAGLRPGGACPEPDDGD